jgi:hypothetical protein
MALPGLTAVLRGPLDKALLPGFVLAMSASLATAVPRFVLPVRRRLRLTVPSSAMPVRSRLHVPRVPLARPTASARPRLGLALAAISVVLAAGCSAISPGPSAGAAGAGSQPVSAAQPAANAQPGAGRAGAPAQAPVASPADAAKGEAAAAQPNQSAQTSQAAGTSLPLDRMVVRTAKLSVQVNDVEQALTRTREIAQAGGGFLSASNTRVEKGSDGQDRTVADLTLQVRGDTLDTTLQALRGLGKVENETSSSQDVTEEYVDLDANLRNLQASESAILKLMDRAQRIEDVISLQRELTNVRGQIERIQGRKRYLERRTDLATISLSLHLPAVDSPAPTTAGWNPVAVALRGWLASLTVLRGVAEVVIVVAAFSWWLLPFVGLGVYVWLHRKPRPRATAET